MKLRDILPHAAIGGIVTIILLVVVEAYSALVFQAGGASSESMVLTTLAMTGLAFVAGGFISAYLAAKKSKDTFDRAVSASAISALLAVAAISALSGAGALLGDFPFLDTLEMAAMAAIFMVAGITLSVIGGMVLSFISGRGKSAILGAFSLAWKSFRAEPRIIAVPMILSLAMYAIMISGGTGDMGDMVPAIAAFAALLMGAFAQTSIVVAMQKKRSMKAVIRETLSRGPRVFFSMVAIGVPIVVASLAMVYGVMEFPEIEFLWSLAFLALAVALALYLFLLAFTPIALAAGKGGLGWAFRESYRFARKRWALILGMMGVVVSLTIFFEVGLLAVDFIAFASGGDASLLTGWMAAFLNITLISAAMAGLYLGEKK